MELTLNSFQQQVVEHFDVTFTGTSLKKSVKTNDDVTYNIFEVKSKGLRFGLDQSAFSGMNPGQKIVSIHPEHEGKIDASENWLWLWPWDIVRIVSELSPFVSTIFNQPKMVTDFISNVDGNKVNPGFARQVSSDTTTWSNFYTNLGGDETYKAFWPEGATVCRIIGGSGEQMPTTNALGKVPEPTEKILKTIEKIAFSLGLITAETIGLAVGILAIVGTACTISAATSGVSAPLCTIIGVILIVCLVVGWAVAVISEIISMIIQGILIWA